MYLFININGIDIFCGNLTEIDGVKTFDIKCTTTTLPIDKNKTALCKVPDFVWTENNGFEEETLTYLVKMLSGCVDAMIQVIEENDRLVYA